MGRYTVLWIKVTTFPETWHYLSKLSISNIKNCLASLFSQVLRRSLSADWLKLWARVNFTCVIVEQLKNQRSLYVTYNLLKYVIQQKYDLPYISHTPYLNYFFLPLLWNFIFTSLVHQKYTQYNIIFKVFYLYVLPCKFLFMECESCFPRKDKFCQSSFSRFQVISKDNII